MQSARVHRMPASGLDWSFLPKHPQESPSKLKAEAKREPLLLSFIPCLTRLSVLLKRIRKKSHSSFRPCYMFLYVPSGHFSTSSANFQCRALWSLTSPVVSVGFVLIHSSINTHCVSILWKNRTYRANRLQGGFIRLVF